MGLWRPTPESVNAYWEVLTQDDLCDQHGEYLTTTMSHPMCITGCGRHRLRGRINCDPCHDEMRDLEVPRTVHIAWMRERNRTQQSMWPQW